MLLALGWYPSLYGELSGAGGDSVAYCSQLVVTWSALPHSVPRQTASLGLPTPPQQALATSRIPSSPRLLPKGKGPASRVTADQEPLHASALASVSHMKIPGVVS